MRPALIAVIASLPVAAVAQEAQFCGGISLVGSWIGAGPDGSDVATLSAPAVADARVPIAGHAVTLFTVSQATALRIDVDGVPEGDPYASVFAEDGREVASDDDGGVDLGVRMDVALEPGTYCLATRSYDDGVADVVVRIGPDAAFGPTTTRDGPAAVARGGCGTSDVARLGEGPLTAADLADGLSVTEAAVARPGYAFTLAEPMGLTVTAIAPDDDADPSIRLMDDAGNVVAENDDADGLDSRFEVVEPMAPGTYCLALEDLDDRDGRIAVTVSSFDPATLRRREIAAMEAAPGVSDAVAVEELGTLATALTTRVEAQANAQWVAFSAPEGGLLLIEAVSPDGAADPMIALFDGLGRPLGRNDDGPVGLDSLLVHRAGPGRYVIGVRTYEDATGPVNVAIERFLPAR